MKTFVFDIDGTICTNTNGKYELATPYEERIKFINNLHIKGNVIKYFTARGSTTGICWRELTEKQLKDWGALYHELILGKPQADLYIDDKAFNCNNWVFPSIKKDESSVSCQKNFSFKEPILNHIEILNKILTDEFISNKVNKLCSKIKETFSSNGKVIFAGNGGSFADSQHLSAEFVCKFKKNRETLPAITLGTNSSNLTAIGNDFGFENIFSRELSAIANKNDFLIAITTSGNSPNINNLVEKAIELGIEFFILTGNTGGRLSKYEDLCIKVPSEDTALVQQAHIILGHIICENSEAEFT